ncbi:Dnaj subfamily b member [Thalictrum thalictroides]|uniref:Dnaj subfamily b member n=1 Tax=Thalictrum thalictroides TaxID=46969 RepID=A0A7J6X332_THATH|nr:Dnaj subfamily b member [Thalictrum thalictroides]
MDCNKDDAIKAKEIAEKKMEIQDFVGAKKTVLKAKQLYPELDSIPQMLTICDVHCAAQVKVSNTEKDWYGILQVELAADEVSIKKQYRKLALLLHPDKNKIAGAEAAFKLIGEAHRVLSDRAQRSLYDMRYKAMKERLKLPPQWQNTTHAAPKQPGVDNNFIRPQFTSVNLHREQNKPGPEHLTFWTACPFCMMRFQYFRKEVNRALVCNSCKKPFVAYDLNIQGVPPGSTSTQPTVSQPKKVSHNVPKVQPQSSARNFSSNVVDQGRYDRKTAPAEIFPDKPDTSKVKVNSETPAEENGRVTREDRRQNGKKPKFAGRKRRRSEEESSESCDTESSNSSDEVAIPEHTEGGAPVEHNSKISEGRRSARQKRQVVYNEDSDDDTVGPRRASRPSTVVGDQKKEEASKTTKADGISADLKKDKALEEQQIDVPSEGSSPNGNAKVEPCNGTAKEAADVEDNRENLNADDLIESPRNKNLPDPEFVEVVDPEFYTFDNDRKEDSFKFDQMWAVYDDMDCMPRFYARIRKILSPGFKVRITWLEADPDDDDEIEWFNEGLPVSCGKYKLGKTEITEDMNMFSHLVAWVKGPSRGTLLIYPRRGETWALFKNWDMKWSSDAENHRTYEYDFVEVLSDYDQGSGISVASLEKVKGFVSLFCRKKGVASIQIPPKELYRFSHMVPSYRTTGNEREGVSEGSFELDPASLPGNLVDPKKM